MVQATLTAAAVGCGCRVSHCWRAGAGATASHTTTTPRLSQDASRLSSSLHATPRTGALCAASAASSRGGCALQLMSTRCTARLEGGMGSHRGGKGGSQGRFETTQACTAASTHCHGITATRLPTLPTPCEPPLTHPCSPPRRTARPRAAPARPRGAARHESWLRP